MIARRQSGVSVFQFWLIFSWVLIWFGINVYVGVEWIGQITYAQTNYGIYILGLVVAQLAVSGNQSSDGSAERRGLWMDSITRTNKLTLVLLTVLFAIVFATKDKGMSRVFLSTYLVSLWPTLLILNRFLPVFVSGFLFGKSQRFTTVLIGSPSKIKDCSAFVKDLPRSGFELAGIVTFNGSDEENSMIPVIGKLEDLNAILDEYSVDQVIVMESETSKKWFNEVFRICDQFGCHVMIFNFWQDYFDQPVHFTRHGIHTFFTLQDEPLQSPFNRIAKRFLDIMVSVPIVFGLLPFMCIWVMIMQSRQSPGPLFHIQYRSGFQKQRFKIFKFRSMHVQKDRSNEDKQATQSDDRVFSFGSFMRRRSIDEFPQFINVLRGDMSVVGPRPHLVKHDSKFADNIQTYRIRHFVKPGLTGLAQVNGFRGEVTDEKSIQNRIKMDIAYINSWSIGMDIDIIFRTISELLRPSDKAY